MSSVSLSVLLDRMNRQQSISTIEEQYKVRDLDEAIRALRRKTFLPAWLKKRTIRVFADIIEYPSADDHARLSYVDNQKIGYQEKERFLYTSVQQFMEDANPRSKLAEIWSDNVLTIGIKTNNKNLSSQLVDNASVLSRYTPSGDATAVALDNVIVSGNTNSSIQVNVVNSSNIATVTISPSAISDANYRKRYVFFSVYLSGIPSSIELKYGTDSSNYLSQEVTTQFNGRPFVEGDFNILAFDLNAATVTGTINSSSFAYAAIVMNDAPTGYYYIAPTFVREWAVYNYWYYTRNSIKRENETTINGLLFFKSDNTYNLADELAGDDEWLDCILYDAMLTSLIDKENEPVASAIASKRKAAWEDLMEKYPTMEQTITTLMYNFETNTLGSQYIDPYGQSLQ